MSLGTRAPIMGLLVFCVGQLVAGCAQDTPDRLGFALPKQTIRISSGDPGWRSAPQTVVPNMVCAGPQALGTDCCVPPSPALPVDCQQYPLTCDPANNFCALTFDVAGSTAVDLVAAVPEVAAVDGRAWSRVSLVTLTVSVGDSPDPAMALPIRSAQLYVGPETAAGVGSPGVRLLGPVALTPGQNVVPLDDEAQAAFSTVARDYRVPFALWLWAHVVVPNGTAPSGTVTFELAGRAEAIY